MDKWRLALGSSPTTEPTNQEYTSASGRRSKNNDALSLALPHSIDTEDTKRTQHNEDRTMTSLRAFALVRTLPSARRVVHARRRWQGNFGKLWKLPFFISLARRFCFWQMDSATPAELCAPFGGVGGGEEGEGKDVTRWSLYRASHIVRSVMCLRMCDDALFFFLKIVFGSLCLSPRWAPCVKCTRDESGGGAPRRHRGPRARARLQPGVHASVSPPRQAPHLPQCHVPVRAKGVDRAAGEGGGF
jgi:hypothetical protein